MSFVHLHLHTDYSMLDGTIKLDALALALKAKGMNTAGMSDHGNMFGAIDFYKKMKENNIKPIVGIETYIHNYTEIGKKELVSDPFKQRFHLCLFAKDEQGYKNLMRLASESYLRGFYYFPRINKDTLKKFSAGLIASSACLAGEINFHLNQAAPRNREHRKGFDGAIEIAKQYQDIFGDDFYIELMRHGIEEQRLIDDRIIKTAKALGIKLIATNDAHYIDRENAEAQEMYMCIASGKKWNDEKRLRHSVKEFFVKSPEEMAALFADIPEAIANTLEIADKCNLELKLGNPTPPNYKFAIKTAFENQIALKEPDRVYSHENDAVLFEILCEKMLQKRLERIDEKDHQMYRDRLKYEIDIIKKMKFCGYMLIVWDFVSYAKKNGVPVGPGRGSAAGSLAAYALEITNIDPIKYGLLFERFLNPERISMPDIDMDFCQKTRDRVIKYVVEAYGQENVGQVITYGSLQAKNAIRDVARVLEVPIPEADRMCKLIPPEIGIKLTEAYDQEPKLRELIASDTTAAKIWEYAKQLEGLKRNSGVHAAGIVISNDELWHKTPLFRPSKKSDKEDEDESAKFSHDVVTQYDGHYLEDVDLIKFDFLGLQNLTTIDHAIKLIESKSGRKIDFSNMPMDDKKVFELIASGNTLGIFQLESEGLQNLSRRLEPSSFEDVIVMIALYRPGPLESGMVDDFVERKHGRAETTYMFPELEPILAPTYGVIVYQEQVMKIVQTIGGFSLGKADLVRRAMGKKDEDLMNKTRAEFVEGAEKQGYPNSKAQELFKLIHKFAEYGFNKSHSAAYAMIAYQTAYLKHYYPAEYMSALLTYDSNRSEKVAEYINEVKRIGLDFLPPSINQSGRDFQPIYEENSGEAKKVIFGIKAIGGVGSKAIEYLLQARDDLGGKFETIGEFLSNIDSQKVNKKVLESLIKAGALDEFGFTRRAMLGSIDGIVKAAQNANNIRKEAKGGLFNDDAEKMANEVSVDIPHLSEYEMKTILEYEKESLGLYVSGHPLDSFREELGKLKYQLSGSIDEIEDGSEVLFIGKVESIEQKMSKKGNKFGIVHLIDLVGAADFMIFERDMDALDKLDLERPIAFRVRVEKNDNRANMRVTKVLKLEDIKNGGEIKPQSKNTKNGNYENYTNYTKKEQKEPQKHITKAIEPVTIEIGEQQSWAFDKLYTIIRENPGENPVKFIVRCDKNDFIIATKLKMSNDAIAEVAKIGVNCVREA